MKFIRIAADMLHKPAAIKPYRLTLSIVRMLTTVLMTGLKELSRLALKALQKSILNRLQKLAEKVHYA
jgi:hypothetical protein